MESTLSPDPCGKNVSVDYKFCCHLIFGVSCSLSFALCVCLLPRRIFANKPSKVITESESLLASQQPSLVEFFHNTLPQRTVRGQFNKGNNLITEKVKTEVQHSFNFEQDM